MGPDADPVFSSDEAEGEGKLVGRVDQPEIYRDADIPSGRVNDVRRSTLPSIMHREGMDKRAHCRR